MPNNGAVTLTPGTADVAIAAGYHSGSGKVVGDPDLMAGNIREGATIFEVIGTSIQASGDAVAGEVLTGKTFSNERGRDRGDHAEQRCRDADAGDGGRGDRGGYHSGFGKVVGDPDLMAGNIREGATIFEVIGTSIQASGDASAGEVLADKTFSKAGAAGLTGTMPNNGAVILTPGMADVAIARGIIDGNGKVVGDADLLAGNIRQGANIFGVAGSSIEASGTAVAEEVLLGKTFSNDGGAGTGTMPNNGAVILTPGMADVAIVEGYHDGNGKVVGDADLLAGNIRQGANIFGVAGSSIEASGDAVAADVLAGKTFSRAGCGGDRGEHDGRRRRDADAWYGVPGDPGGLS